MHRLIACFAFLAVSVALCGCGGSGFNSQPSVTVVDPYTSGVLQLAVGVATMQSSNGTVGHALNLVETFRQSNGLSASLYNKPVVTLPANSTNEMFQSTTPPDTDVGLNVITDSTFDQLTPVGGVGIPSGLNGSGNLYPFPSVGAFGYGFCTCNADQGATTGFQQLYAQPGAAYYGGPPAFPALTSDQIQNYFVGYSLGFTVMSYGGGSIAPQAGPYRLDLSFAPYYTSSGNTSGESVSASAQLSNTQGLPPFPQPSFAPDGKGGGTITASVPSGVTEAFAFVRTSDSDVPYTPTNCSRARPHPMYYTVRLPISAHATVQLPDAIGAPDANGNATPSICPGVSSGYSVYAVGFDYPAFEAAYPSNLQQTPQIASPNGQADVTLSAGAPSDIQDNSNYP